MTDYKSSQHQLNEEMKQLYHSMTDPDAIAARKQREEVAKRIKHKKQRYGL